MGFTGTTVAPIYKVATTGMKNSKQFSLLIATPVPIFTPDSSSALARLQDFSSNDLPDRDWPVCASIYKNTNY